MKLLKIGWYCSMAALFIAGRATGRREFFLLLFIMGFVLLYVLILNLWTIFTFCYVQETDRKATVKGTGLILRLSIHNDKPYPFPLIRLKVTTVVRSKQTVFSFSLLPNSKVSYEIPLPCPYRGIYSVGMSTVEARDCFGLLNTSFEMNLLPYYRQIELKVYPRLVTLPVLPSKQRDVKDWQGAGGRYADSGEEFAVLRAYRPGDPLKRIHRVASAKLRELYVKTYNIPVESSVMIVLDTVIPGSSSRKNAGSLSEEDILYLGDLACEAAAAIAHYSLCMSNRVIYSDSSPLGVLICESVRDFQRIVERLAVIQFDRKGDFMETLTAAVKMTSEFHTIYVLTANGENRMKVSAALKGQRIKWIRLTHLRADAVNDAALQDGIQYIQMSVGDDIASILSEVSL